MKWARRKIKIKPEEPDADGEWREGWEFSLKPLRIRIKYEKRESLEKVPTTRKGRRGTIAGKWNSSSLVPSIIILRIPLSYVNDPPKLLDFRLSVL